MKTTICKGYTSPYTPPRCEHEWQSWEMDEGKPMTTCVKCGAILREVPSQNSKSADE